MQCYYKVKAFFFVANENSEKIFEKNTLKIREKLFFTANYKLKNKSSYLRINKANKKVKKLSLF